MIARVFGAVLVLAAGVAQAQSPETLSWLRKIHDATQRLSYTGTFVYQNGAHTETSRITRYVDASGDIEKLEILDGVPREIVRTKDTVRCYLPDSRVQSPINPALSGKPEYAALVERGLSSMVSGALLPTVQPFLYTLSFTALDGVPLPSVEEAATEEIERVRAGGVEPGELLRAKRQLVSSTFNYVVIPMHIALAGVLVFVSEVVSAFNVKLVEAQAIVNSENTSTINPQEIGIPGALSFQEFNTAFIKMMVLGVIIALTIVNAFAPRAAAGGHHFKLAFFGSLTMLTSGLVLLIVPPMAMSMSDTVQLPPM